MYTSKKITSNFIERLLNSIAPKNPLLLNFTRPSVLELKIEGVREIESENDFEKYNNPQFDLIIGDLPFGLDTIPFDSVSKLRVSRNWNYMLTALRKLNSVGQAFFLVEPSILFSQRGKSFLSDLASEKYFINAVFELPEKLLYPQTAFQPILIAFERLKEEMLFIGQITSEHEVLTKNYLLKVGTDNIVTGLVLNRDSFESFNKFRIEAEIKSLKTQYNDYVKYNLIEVSKEINFTREEFEERPNCLYIPKLGSSPVVSSLSKTTLKHQNYFQIVLDDQIVKAEFLELFYHSELGKLILRSLSSGSYIPKINKADIETSIVAIPKLEEQNLLAHTNQKLSELQDILNELKTDLSLNPKNAGILLDKCESVQGPLKLLSIEDQIFSLIRKGENKHIEFKQTFSKNIRTGQKDKEIEKASLKTIVGFLNADGGTLLIGVSDEGRVTGIDDDFFTSHDKYKLHFKNALNEKIGQEFYSLIDFDLYQVSERLVLKVDCSPSNEPCFYDEREFYVRTNPATDRLEGKKQVDYIRTHFK